MGWLDSIQSFFGPSAPAQAPAIAHPEVGVPSASDSELDKQISTLKQQLPAKSKTLIEAMARYGHIEDNDGNPTWPDEAKWCSMLLIPADIAAGWINSATGKPTTRIYCNKDIHVPLILALLLVKKRGLLHELKTFGGCYKIRMVRGSTTSLSTHSYATAIDMNEKDMPLGADSKWSSEFVSCFTEAGFTFGGNFHRKDPMHFSRSWE